MKNKAFLNIALGFAFIMLLYGCAKEETKPLEEAQEVVDTGIIAVDSTPSQAHVYVDNELKGDTPLNLYNIPVGAYNVVIKKDGYRDFEKTINVKVGKTEEISANLVLLEPQKSTSVEQKKQAGEAVPAAQETAKTSKIDLSSFAMYYDFEGMQFSETRTDKSDLFSRKYENYVHFTALVPAKINVIIKPIKDVQKEDCIFSDNAVALIYSGQTLCVKTAEGNVVAIGGTWQAMPTELEWIKLT